MTVRVTPPLRCAAAIEGHAVLPGPEGWRSPDPGQGGTDGRSRTEQLDLDLDPIALRETELRGDFLGEHELDAFDDAFDGGHTGRVGQGVRWRN